MANEVPMRTVVDEAMENLSQLPLTAMQRFLVKGELNLAYISGYADRGTELLPIVAQVKTLIVQYQDTVNPPQTD